VQLFGVDTSSVFGVSSKAEHVVEQRVRVGEGLGQRRDARSRSVCTPARMAVISVSLTPPPFDAVPTARHCGVQLEAFF